VEAVALDAWALVGYMLDQPCAEVVGGWLRRAERAEVALAMTSVNWGETVYRIAGQHAVPVDVIVARLDLLPIELISVDRNLAVRAARLKSEYGLAYADSFAAALALALGAPLMTGDSDFRERLPALRLEWIGE
jgi:predicted nucleic acid-binding protein